MNAELINKENEVEQMEKCKLLRILSNFSEEEKEQLYWMIRGAKLVHDYQEI